MAVHRQIWSCKHSCLKFPVEMCHSSSLTHFFPTLNSPLLSASPAAMAGPRPVVFSGPSGAGKSTLLKKLMKEYDSVFGFSVSRKCSYESWSLSLISVVKPAGHKGFLGDSGCIHVFLLSLIQANAFFKIQIGLTNDFFIIFSISYNCNAKVEIFNITCFVKVRI